MEFINKKQQESWKWKNHCNEEIENEYLKDKKHCKFTDHCHYTREYRGAAHSIAKKIQTVFHNGSNYDYHFMKKKL